MGAPPRNERQRPAPGNDGPFVIPPTENPIIFGANAIRDVTKAFVAQDLNGLFPRNANYGHNDYNVVYHPIGTQHHPSRLIVLTPQGDLSSGPVESELGSCTQKWKIEEATLKPARDLEVVREGPVVLQSLFRLLMDELPEQDEASDVIGILAALKRKQDILERVREISQVALAEMGEKPSEKPQESEQDRQVAEAEERVDSRLLSSTQATLSLYQDKDQIIHEIELIAKNGRAGRVQDAILALVQRGVDANLFPSNEFEDSESLGYVADGVSVSYGSGRLQALHGDRIWNIVIKDGEIQETWAYYGRAQPNRTCPEHVLEKGPEIAKRIIGKAVAKVFPDLIWRETPQAAA